MELGDRPEEGFSGHENLPLRGIAFILEFGGGVKEQLDLEIA